MGALADRARIEKARWNEREHPRGPDGRFVESMGQLTYTGIVHAEVPRSDPFGPGTFVADVQSVSDDGESATVSLHLDSTHSAVQDAMGDAMITSPDEMEAITTLPTRRLSTENMTRPFRPDARRAAAEVKVRRARRQREAERRENQEAYRRGEIPRGPRGMIGLEELDRGRDPDPTLRNLSVAQLKSVIATADTPGRKKRAIAELRRRGLNEYGRQIPGVEGPSSFGSRIGLGGGL